MNYTPESKYYAGCDGTKLAVDLYRPVTDEKIPVLIKAGYAPRRSVMELPYERQAIERFVNAGYAVAIVEVRGSGASFGVSDGFFTRKDARDLAALIYTLTREEWCNGKAGMYGGSNHGMIQEITACEQPENLLAIVPCDCSMDFYYQDFPNGVSALPEFKENLNYIVPLGTPVDDDSAPDYPLLHKAADEHERNKPFLFQHIKNMYRDDLNPALGYRPNIDIPAWERMDEVRFGHINTWSFGAWFDPGCTNKILTYKSWGGKLTIGPWPHCGVYANNSDFPNSSYDWVRKHIEYFDSILKGKDNNSLHEPPIQYYTIGDTGNEWHYEADFPITGTTYPEMYFADSGKLTTTPPEEGRKSYTVRQDIMIYEEGMRMNRNVRKDMTSEDQKSLVFTSDALPGDLELTGIPNIELYVTSTYKDGIFIAVLEEVTPDNISHFMTEGFIRASNSKIQRNAVYESMGISYHRGFREDIVEMSDKVPLKLVFHLEALSRIVKAGSRIRISITCGGSGLSQPEGFPKKMPTISLYYGKRYASKIILPVIKPIAHEFETNGVEFKLYKKAIYIKKNGRYRQYSCLQVYPESRDILHYETQDFTATVTTHNSSAKLEITKPGDRTILYSASTTLPDRFTFGDQSGEIPVAEYSDSFIKPDIKALYVATVPVSKGDYKNVNFQLRSTFDLFISLKYPAYVDQTARVRYKLPCIVFIHGFGGNHYEFPSTTDMFLNRGFAIASIDYRSCPPNVWPSSDDDAKACIRYLKYHSSELGLDPERFGVIGGSMGGNLTAMIAATNGSASDEGHIGLPSKYTSSVKAGAAYYAFTDYLHFGDDAAEIWPAQPDKVNQSDGPYAPLASLLGYVGEGKGLGEAKNHLFDDDPKYVKLLDKAKKASPISHVTKSSAPLCLVHGIYDYGVQVPMGQSMRMFKAYSGKGVKSIVLLNNMGPYGDDPEVMNAVVQFMTNRI